MLEDHDSVITVLEDLIRIDSSNPGLVSGAPGESRIADYATAWLTSHGFECHRLEETSGRPSIVAISRGTGTGRSIMLNGHLDTVSLGSYDGDGLVPRHRDGNIYGRGAYDMKSGVAAIMVAASKVAARPHAGDIILALVADEEFASAGTEEVLRHYSADCAVVVEPSGLDIVTAHRGFAWFDITIHGRAAHGSRRDLGIDAIVKAGAFLTALGQHDRELAKRTPHRMLGTANIHASVISGGEEQSSYPASCRIALERRTLPGETAATVETELRAILDSIAADDPEFIYSVHAGLERNPFSVDPHEAIVASLIAAAEHHSGTTPTVRGEAFWTDCALLADAGIPTVLFGVDGGGAHAAEEWVTIDSLVLLTSILEEVVTHSISKLRDLA
ncbi:ArgE/DapE family deacylase [Salinibacterium sp. M195]|uniref:ArgE/DapE family deacylase n=1 Tax=Salinibacterium sp. M195 TaxID=2583374 RepID=UPI001C626902|nr:ArgE/DapE family deacylase [Salinibacterium sp. M195]QYH36344.1 ArgE/DapE family deacylase [Salinibacterium sp. M195]